jgi:hypothetical protein
VLVAAGIRGDKRELDQLSGDYALPTPFKTR